MITRSPSPRSRNFMESLSDSIGHGRVTRCTDVKNTQRTTGGISMRFPQDTHHFCTTVDRSTGTVSDSRMEAQCNCPECQRPVHQLVRHFHSPLHRLVDVRHRQETPDTHSFCVQFVIVLVMKAPKADRVVAWSTDRDSTRTVAPTLGLW